MGRKDTTGFAAIPPFLPDQEVCEDGRAQGVCCAHPMAKTMNIWLQEARPGRVIFRGAPEPRHTNQLGDVHAGWPATILDSALGCVILTRAPAGMGCSTLALNTNIVQPLVPGEEVEAVAEVQHFGRSTGMASAELRGVQNGTLYATGTATCLILPLGGVAPR